MKVSFSNRKSRFCFVALTALLVIAPLADLLSTAGQFNFNAHIKGGLFFCVVLVSAVYGTQKSLTWVFSFLLIIPLISYLASSTSLAGFLSNANYLLKVALPILLIPAILGLKSRHHVAVIKAAKLSIIFYCAMILCGALLEIESFRSYPESIRFGYKGIILAQNEASALLLLGFIIFSWDYAYKKNRSDLFGCLILLISMVLIGTKAGLICALLCPMIMLFFNYSLIGFLRYTALLVVIGVLAVWSAYAVSESFRLSMDANYIYFTHQWNYYAEKNLVKFLLSGRNLKTEYLFADLMGHPSVLFIGGWEISKYMSEVDFIDMLAVVGLPILMFYLYLVINISKSNSGRYSPFHFCFLVLVIALANTAGHVLISALAAPYMAIFITLQKMRQLELRDE